MPTLDTLGNTSTSARERQCTNAIRPNDHVGICLSKTSLRREDIGRTLFGAATRYFATHKELQSRNFDPDLQFRIDELPNIGVEFPGSLEDDERSRLCNPEISGLPGRRVGGIYVTMY